MAGSGVALRLHEFKGSKDTRDPTTLVSRRLGRDVLGLYPGQIARVHAVSSSLARVTSPGPLYYDERAERCFQKNFDLLTLQMTLQSDRQINPSISDSQTVVMNIKHASFSASGLRDQQKRQSQEEEEDKDGGERPVKSAPGVTSRGFLLRPTGSG
ncbi:hypothetical protein DNTS_017145 [Danionella cerebrum]|uniref:Uncharacterized protein n=1 Tax=Danionella cerebrum TaxID=2873325 RepID=A0A553NG87_9TELE|nr:hypothetical protein DNTS_017145 [Danionella translucida]